jgi:hypothetical protein
MSGRVLWNGGRSINLDTRRGMEHTRNWPLTVRQQVRVGLNSWPVEFDLKIKYSGRKGVHASQASESKTARRRRPGAGMRRLDVGRDEQELSKRQIFLVQTSSDPSTRAPRRELLSGYRANNVD